MAGKVRILHTEVGGTYGGSLRALEVYLRFADHTRFAHDVLFYYPTPGAERIIPLADVVHVLHDSVPQLTGLSKALRGSALRMGLHEARLWLGAIQAVPAASRIHKLLLANSYQLVHVNSTFTYQTAVVMAARRSGLPAVSHVRNPVPDSGFNRWLMRSLKMVVTVSRNYETQLRQWNLPVPVHTCHDGVVVPAADAVTGVEIRKSFAPEGEILVGSVGRLDHQKSYDDLIRAVRLIVDRKVNVRVVIAGEGPLRGELEAQIASLGLSGVVHLCGFRSDVSNFISALDLFVSSSRWEGLPIALVEAMLLGRPVVATDVGGVSEVVEPGQTGYLVPSQDPLALAEAVLKAIEEQKSRPGIFLEAGRRVAAEITDPERSARSFEQRINEALER